MADLAWPADVPIGVEQGSYSESPAKVTVRSNMDSGPAKVRRRFTSGIKPLTVTTGPLTPDQADALFTFFEQITGGGALRFDFTHPRTGDTVEVRFTEEPPTLSAVSGNLYRYSIKLEIMP